MVHASRAAQSTAEKFGCNASTHPSILSGLSDHPTRRVAYLKSVREPSRFRAPAGVSFAKCVVTALLYYFVPPLGQCELDFGYKVDDVVTYLPATEAKGKHEVVGAAAYSIASLSRLNSHWSHSVMLCCFISDALTSYIHRVLYRVPWI